MRLPGPIHGFSPECKDALCGPLEPIAMQCALFAPDMMAAALEL